MEPYCTTQCGGGVVVTSATWRHTTWRVRKRSGTKCISHTYGLVRVHFRQIRLQAFNGPRDFALDRLVLELLVGRLHDDGHRIVLHDVWGCGSGDDGR